jgi:hypothetical protein
MTLQREDMRTTIPRKSNILSKFFIRGNENHEFGMRLQQEAEEPKPQPTDPGTF